MNVFKMLWNVLNGEGRQGNLIKDTIIATLFLAIVTFSHNTDEAELCEWRLLQFILNMLKIFCEGLALTSSSSYSITLYPEHRTCGNMRQ